jgi:hypothetical protein
MLSCGFEAYLARPSSLHKDTVHTQRAPYSRFPTNLIVSNVVNLRSKVVTIALSLSISLPVGLRLQLGVLRRSKI